jgi:hypothetical protein
MPFVPSLGSLNALMASLNAAAGNYITLFVNAPSGVLWLAMDLAIAAWITGNSNAIGLRVGVTLPDGTLCYDSHSDNNTFIDFENKTIGENHNSRIAILQALLSNNGVGFETKISTTTQTATTYLAQRIWPSNGLAMGVIRISVDAIGTPDAMVDAIGS